MRKLLLDTLIVLTGVMISFSASGSKITASKVGSKINVTIDGKIFTSYIFSEDEKYPLFYPVNGSLSGGSVTSMRNAEYPHHSSLFFGCDLVNGGNYWQEGLERGRIISVNAMPKSGKSNPPDFIYCSLPSCICNPSYRKNRRCNHCILHVPRCR